MSEKTVVYFDVVKKEMICHNNDLPPSKGENCIVMKATLKNLIEKGEQPYPLNCVVKSVNSKVDKIYVGVEIISDLKGTISN